MMGSFAEYLALPRADRNLSLLPEGVSFVESAALGCRFSTAFRAVLQQGKLVKGQTVGVFGCGGLGLSCIMIAACHGASKIVAVDLSESSLRKSKEIGATHVVDAKENRRRSKRGHEAYRTESGSTLPLTLLVSRQHARIQFTVRGEGGEWFRWACP